MKRLKEQARRRVVSFMQKLKDNPQDADAAYQLSLHYAHGWGGLNVNDTEADRLLRAAADQGHAQACYDLARQLITDDVERAAHYVNLGLSINLEDQQLLGLRSVLNGLQSMRDNDAKQQSAAQHIFQNRIRLEDAIRKDVFPCVVSIKTDRGVVGTGFFQHSEWLVSNAHVLPSSETLGGAMLVDFENHETALEPKRAFHRPHEVEQSPDIVIIHGNSRTTGNNKSLPLSFSGDDDCGGRVLFYVYFNHLSQQCEIKYLTGQTEPNVYPMQYACEDGTEPQPGCSGAPVIEARVLVGGHDIQWQFNTVGIIYARCPGADDKKLACAIPVSQEFKQILNSILFPELHAERAGQMADALIGNSQAVTDDYAADSHKHTVLAQNGFKAFEAGATFLDIEVPENLEKLLGTAIISLKSSAFLIEIQRKYKLECSHIKTITLEELCTDLKNFLFEIKQETTITLRPGNTNEFLLSPGGLFRVDVSGGIKGPFVLDIQDNVGTKGQHVPRTETPISSKFAIAVINKENPSIQGLKLAGLFANSLHKDSQELLGPLELSESPSPEPVRFMWYAYCSNGHEPWTGRHFNTKPEAVQELNDKGHTKHHGTIKQKKLKC